MHSFILLLIELAVSAAYKIYRARKRTVVPAGYGPILACGPATIRGEGTVIRRTP